VLVSSHLLGEVQQICDRVGVIVRGRLVREGTIADLRGTADLRVVAAPLDRAAARARALLGPDAVRLADGGLTLTVDGDRAGEINTSLVSAGVTVSELRTVERDLEEAFFDLTGGVADVG
jgi:ABC-2 type transport system ATP-binding protein